MSIAILEQFKSIQNLKPEDVPTFTAIANCQNLQTKSIHI
jgi:hypothetical protein